MGVLGPGMQQTIGAIDGGVGSLSPLSRPDRHRKDKLHLLFSCPSEPREPPRVASVPQWLRLQRRRTTPSTGRKNVVNVVKLPKYPDEVDVTV